jgi:hypothetical protein
MTMNLFTKKESLDIYDYIMGEIADLSDDLSYKLYCILLPEMPYGTAKARTSTPEDFYVEYFGRMDVSEISDWIDRHTEKE